MFQRRYQVTAPEGLHARPAAQLVQVWARCPFAVSLTLIFNTVNAKSILQVLSLGAQRGDQLVVTYDTDDWVQVASCENDLEGFIDIIPG